MKLLHHLNVYINEVQGETKAPRDIAQACKNSRALQTNTGFADFHGFICENPLYPSSICIKEEFNEQHDNNV